MHLIIKIISATSFISALGPQDYFYYFFLAVVWFQNQVSRRFSTKSAFQRKRPNQLSGEIV